MATLSEQETLARARRGDPEAFRALVERYTGRVFAVARGLVYNQADAEDITQEVFFKVHAKLQTFREEAAFSTWLYRVTVNAASDYIKKRRREKASSVEDMTRLPLEDPSADPPSKVAKQALRSAVREAISELPRKFRTVLVLRELEGLSYLEISRILGISKGTVESRIFRARGRLKKQLKGTLKSHLDGSDS